MYIEIELVSISSYFNRKDTMGGLVRTLILSRCNWGRPFLNNGWGDLAVIFKALLPSTGGRHAACDMGHVYGGKRCLNNP